MYTHRLLCLYLVKVTPSFKITSTTRSKGAPVIRGNTPEKRVPWTTTGNVRSKGKTSGCLGVGVSEIVYWNLQT